MYYRCIVHGAWACAYTTGSLSHFLLVLCWNRPPHESFAGGGPPDTDF